MITMWLVLSGRWDIAGKSFNDWPAGAFFSSALLAGLELLAEFQWLLWLFGVAQ